MFLKKLARGLILRISWGLASSYIKKHKPVVIGVVGSVGKTGTKRAIAHVLSAQKKVAWQDGNYNDLVTVPLVFFGQEEPSLFNPFAWLATHLRMFRMLNKPGVDVVVLEIGTDGIGQISEFGKFLQLDIAVVTAISHEHMEYFGTIEAVIKEELAVMDFAEEIFVAEDVIQYLSDAQKSRVKTYGSSNKNDYWFQSQDDLVKLHTSEGVISAHPELHGQHQMSALIVASEIATQLDLTPENIAKAVESLQSMPGRMNVLKGKQGSVIIDDTYNSSPSAVVEALNYLYKQPTPKKIAVLGNMNEMGSHSPDLHRQVADKCDPEKLDMVITIGQDANKYLAPAAEKQGCLVQQFDSPYKIGDFLASQDLSNTTILFKGSQNGVYLEEAVKLVLDNDTDTKYLVRQSEHWLKLKQDQFKDK